MPKNDSKTQPATKSEREGINVFFALMELLKKGGTIRSGTETEEMGSVKGRRRFVIFTQDKDDNE